ncbi:MAG: hypothetical protein ACK5IR_13345, partial [Tropicimonas sp.]
MAVEITRRDMSAGELRAAATRTKDATAARIGSISRRVFCHATCARRNRWRNCCPGFISRACRQAIFRRPCGDGRSLLFTDSPTRRVEMLEIDPESGAVTGTREVLRL